MPATSTHGALLLSSGKVSLSHHLGERRYTLPKMSSLVDAVLNSDTYGGPFPSSRPDQPSSSRPRPPPSTTSLAPSETGMFPDDEIATRNPARARNPLDRNIPKVGDQAGEKVQQAFEDFLESHVEEPPSSVSHLQVN